MGRLETLREHVRKIFGKLDGFKSDYPMFFFILRILVFVIGTTITLYMLVVSFIRYEKYANRADFRLEIVNSTIPNKTYSYILRRSANISQCSSKSRFEANVTILYEVLVKKPGFGLFHAVFWLNVLIGLIVTFFDFIHVINLLCKCGRSDTERKFHHYIIDRLFLRFMVATMITPPTYYISAFDFSKTCLEIRTNGDISAFADLMVMAIISPVVGLSILTAVWIANCMINCKPTITFRPTEIYSKFLKDKPVLIALGACCCCYCGWGFVFFIGMGCFFWYLMIATELTRSEGIMIIISAFF